MLIKGHDVKFLLGSGATVNVLPESVYRRVCEDPELNGLDVSRAILSTNGTKLTPFGRKRISVRNPRNNKQYNLEFQIVSEDNKPVLGASAIQGMQLITVNAQNILTVESSNERSSTDTRC